MTKEVTKDLDKESEILDIYQQVWNPQLQRVLMYSKESSKLQLCAARIDKLSHKYINIRWYGIINYPVGSRNFNFHYLGQEVTLRPETLDPQVLIDVMQESLLLLRTNELVYFL